MSCNLSYKELDRLEDFVHDIPNIVWQRTIYGLSFFSKYRLAIRFCKTIDEIKEAIRNLQYNDMCVDVMIENGFAINFCDNECLDFFAIRDGLHIYCNYIFIDRKFQMYTIINRVTIHIESPSQMVEIFQKNRIHVV